MKLPKRQKTRTPSYSYHLAEVGRAVDRILDEADELDAERAKRLGGNTMLFSFGKGDTVSRHDVHEKNKPVLGKDGQPVREYHVNLKGIPIAKGVNAKQSLTVSFRTDGSHLYATKSVDVPHKIHGPFHGNVYNPADGPTDDTRDTSTQVARSEFHPIKGEMANGLEFDRMLQVVGAVLGKADVHVLPVQAHDGEFVYQPNFIVNHDIDPTTPKSNITF